jgi:cytochrome d ubiquinol oxidase subunit I
MDASTLNYGRALMGDSLGFHIIFALFGVGIPLLLSLAEFLGLLRKDNEFYTMARRWSFTMGTLFVVGAASGLIISNQFSALWPNFTEYATKVVGVSFYAESFAFFIEAIFLGIYLYTWDRFANRWLHWLCSLPLVIFSLASAFAITTANAWMNSPAGFQNDNGQPINIHPLAAVFNPATPTETLHSISSYYLAAVLAFAGMYAIFIWRNKRNQAHKEEVQKDHAARENYYRKAMSMFMICAAIFTAAVLFTGDKSGQYLAHYEPLKLAAAEWLQQSQSHAPLVVGGILTSQGIVGALKYPGMLSWLGFHSTSAVVKGLNAFNPISWPPLAIHYFFDLMVGGGILLSAIVYGYFVLYAIKRRYPFNRWFLALIIISPVIAIASIEFGWVLTEIGRQPYAIAGIMTTAQAFTNAPNVEEFGYIFPSLYVVLFIITPCVLRRHYKKSPLDLSINYFSDKQK